MRYSCSLGYFPGAELIMSLNKSLDMIKTKYLPAMVY